MDIREVYCSSADKSNSKLQLLVESHIELDKENTMSEREDDTYQLLILHGLGYPVSQRMRSFPHRR